MSLQPTALTPVYAAGAREWTELLGRRYPQAFSDAVDEHHTVRRAAGVFDFSFMTHARVRGPGASAFVQRLITNDATRLVPGRIVYSPICNEAGGMVDDCTVIRHGDEWLVTTGLRSTAAWIGTQASGFDVAVEDCSSALVVVAVQGPTSAEVLAALGIADAMTMVYYSACTASFEGTPLLVARLGYTAELGFELFASAASAAALWSRLVQLAPPCGAHALDSLRIEAGLPLTGVDFDPTVSPYEIGLERFVRLDKVDFIGRAALIGRSRPARRLTGLRLDGGLVPARGARVVDAAGAAVGSITSACLAPTLGTSVALAMLSADARRPLSVEGEHAESMPLPFYDPERRRARARPIARPAGVA